MGVPLGLTLIAIGAGGLFTFVYGWHFWRKSAREAVVKEVDKSIRFGYDMHRLGITRVAKDWRDIRDDPVVRQRLARSMAGSVWLFMNCNPHGFSDHWGTHIIRALLRGVQIYWLYFPFDPETDEHAVGTSLHGYIEAQVPGRALFEARSIAAAVERVKYWNEAARAEGGACVGQIQLFQSRVPHPYVAFLSVRRTSDDNDSLVSMRTLTPQDGDWGLVFPYQLYRLEEEKKYGLLLEAPGAVFDQYYQSTIRLLVEGVNCGYVCRCQQGRCES